MDANDFRRIGQFVRRRGRKNASSVSSENVQDTVTAEVSTRGAIRPIWQQGPVPLIGVVTPVRNRLNWSISFVQQMLAQNYPFLRLYIVDADSNDGTPDAIKALGHSAVEVISVPSSSYWTGATNAGVRRAIEAGCDYVLTLNDDAIVPPLFVQTLVSSAVARDLKIVGSVISYASEPGRVWGVGAYNDWQNGNFLQTKYANLWADTVDELKKDIIEVECLCGNGTLIHRTVFDEVGLYNLKFTPHYHADAEFTLRARGHGIQSYVATDAWIYNRFYDATDGAMTARNRRYFSLRSVNYLKSLIFILSEYCPRDTRVVSFCRYIDRYVFDAGDRTISIIVRTALFLSEARMPDKFRPADFYCTGYVELDFCRDLLRVIKLEGADFLAVVSLLIIRRSLNDLEKAHYLRYVETEEDRKVVVLDLMKRPEFTANKRSLPEITLLIGNGESALDEKQLLECSDASFVISRYLLKEIRLPTTREVTEGISRLRIKSRQEAFPGLDFRIGTAGSQKPLQLSDNSEKPIVYINADVLCMGQLDERAKTGVFRYVWSLVDYARRDPRITLKLFYSSGLESGWERLIEDSNELEEFCVDRPVRGDVEGKADIVYFPYFPYNEFDGRFSGQKRVFMLHDLFPVTNSEWFTKEATSKFLRQLRQLSSAEHIFCNSAETQKHLRAYAPTLRGSMSVAHLGVAAPQALGDRSAAEIAKIAVSGEYMLCIGTLEPRKNLGTVIKALARLPADEFDHVRLVVVGASGWNVDFAKEASALGNRVSFLGHVSDIDLWTLYRSAVCTVFPSLAEGFGFPIIESFACGTPVITSKHSSMAEIAGNAAVLVDPLDATSISSAMIGMLRDSESRELLSKRGLERAKEFTWEKCVDKHIQQFLSIYEAASPERKKRFTLYQS